MFDFERQIPALRRQTVLCIGDVMLDDFVYGDVSRISPEAPAPVIAVRREDMIVGGAGNVARNLASLGARCILVGVIGKDSAGATLKAAIAEHRTIRPMLVADASRPTTRKLRFVSEHHSTHLLRADWEDARPVDAEDRGRSDQAALAALPRVGAVVLSDYAKGVLTPKLVRAVIERAAKLKKPVIVDPKGLDFSIYRGATVVTPNRKELGEATHRSVASLDEVNKAAGALARTTASKAVLVTLSEDGMALLPGGRPPIHAPAFPVKVRDVSGAGDTVVAVLSLLLAAGLGFEDAMRTANAAASV